MRIELTTFGLGGRYSTIEPRGFFIEVMLPILINIYAKWN